MKRPIFFAVLTLMLLLAAMTALAMPAQQDVRPVIAQPAQDAPVRGVVQIVGTATHPQFQKYQIYFAPWPVPSDDAWAFVSEAFTQQQLGLLGTWDSRTVTDGTYALRVRVVKLDGNYHDSDPRRVLVANTRSVASPTPEVIETPEPLPTELPVTPTVAVVTEPTGAATAAVTLEPQPTPTPEPEVTPLLPGEPSADTGGTDSSATGIADQLFSGEQLLSTAKKAVLYTVGAFLAIGLFFGVKALLVWLWHKNRP